MDLWKNLKARLSTSYRYDEFTGSTASTWGLTGGEPTMYELYLWLQSDVDYALAVEQMADLAVGGGYYLTAPNDDNEKGTAHNALVTIEQMAEDIDLDQWCYTTAAEAWAYGNSFSTSQDEDGILTELNHVPIASMRDIKTDALGHPVSYIQDPNYRVRAKYSDMPLPTDGTLITIPAEQIYHFAIRRLNASPWGTGIGQIQAREGRGYQKDNKTHRRMSLFKQRELFSHAKVNIFWQLQSRLFLKTKGTVNNQKELQRTLNNAAPGGTILSTSIEDAKAVSIDTSSKHADMTQSLQQDSASANMTGINRILDPSQTSYAASETTRRAQMPFVDSFRRRLKRYIEQEIIRPTIEARFGDWKKYRIELSWEPQQDKGIEHWEKVVKMVSDSSPLSSRIDWDELVSTMAADGIELTKLSRETMERVAQHAELLTKENMHKKATEASIEQYRKEQNDLAVRKIIRSLS